MAVMAARQTTTIRANITAYSTAVGPSSETRNRFTLLARFLMVVPLFFLVPARVTATQGIVEFCKKRHVAIPGRTRHPKRNLAPQRGFLQNRKRLSRRTRLPNRSRTPSESTSRLATQSRTLRSFEPPKTTGCSRLDGTPFQSENQLLAPTRIGILCLVSRFGTQTYVTVRRSQPAHLGNLVRKSGLRGPLRFEIIGQHARCSATSDYDAFPKSDSVREFIRFVGILTDANSDPLRI